MFYRYFATKFTQIIHVKDDPKVTCDNYEEESYDSCDQDFINRTLNKYYPPDFVPIWATNNFSMVTTLIETEREEKFEDNYADIVSGVENSGV